MIEKNKQTEMSDVTVTSREKLTATGVYEVTGFDELQIEAKTAQGMLLVRGNGLHIDSFDADVGELVLSGRIDGMVYCDREPKRGFWAGLLK
ncbi:MAG: sporulation protein YabP [Ruminococcaceae bacterium]|nr:sporulation protein YabP [Oscillospiraceae bacterium]